MAEGDGSIYNGIKSRLLKGEIDLTGDSPADVVKVMLVVGYTPDIDADDKYSDVSASEVSDASYSAGGNELTGLAVSEDDTNDRALFNADDLTFTALSVGTPSHAIAYDDTHADKPLICYWEIGRASNGADYTLTWGSVGLVVLT